MLNFLKISVLGLQITCSTVLLFPCLNLFTYINCAYISNDGSLPLEKLTSRPRGPNHFKPNNADDILKDDLTSETLQTEYAEVKNIPGKTNSKLLKLKEAPFNGCKNDAYPPNEKTLVKKEIINLDLPPRERWKVLVQKQKQQLKKLVTYMEGFMTTLLGPRIFNFVNQSLPQLAATLPPQYYREIEGIASAGGLSVSQVTLYNIFYEVFTFCTSVVIQTKEGRILHGRNLDFGLFLGWDIRNHTWIVSELLRPLVVQVVFQKDKKTLYESVTYTGFIGVITASKKGKFSVTLNDRFSLNGGYIGLLEWIIFGDHNQKWVTFLIRDVMETAESFTQAQTMLSAPRLLAPAYFILSGVEPGQGVLITRFRSSSNLLKIGSRPAGQASWFLVETNYDHWKRPPFYDDRRTPAIQCLEEGGQSNASLRLIYNVLSTRPVLNKLTTYTTLMDTKKGIMKTLLRDCPNPCWPW